jgi:hypothetical protein
VEPLAGSFTVSLLAAQAGWEPSQIEASGTDAYTVVCGSLFAGRKPSLWGLDGLYADNVQTELPEVPLERAATLLWLQLLHRIQAKPEVPFWEELAEDLFRRKDDHVRAISAGVAKQNQFLHGITFQPIDVWSHLEQVVDDPGSVIICNPPTYTNKQGILEHDWVPKTDWPRLWAHVHGKPALFLGQQQAEPGKAIILNPSYGRQLSPGQIVYILSNRPKEIEEVTRGPQARMLDAGQAVQLDGKPLVKRCTTILERSTIEILPVPNQVALYYRKLWTHRIELRQARYDALVLLDGQIAGCFGIQSSSVWHRSYKSRWPGSLILTYAIGAPHEKFRLTRLMTSLALSRPVLERVVTDDFTLAAATGMITVEFSKYPEAKGLRGLMKLEDREKVKSGFRLVYHSGFSGLTPEAVLEEWLGREMRYIG